MGSILPFPVHRPILPRGGPAIRLVAIFVLLLFTAAVIWSAVVSMGGSSLTPDVRDPPLRAVP